MTAKAGNISKAAAIVRKGGVIAYPTDTVYGLGCDPFNESAVTRLLQIKHRDQKPLPVLISSINRARHVADFTLLEKKFIKAVWPGAVTILVTRKSRLPPYVTFGAKEVGLRIPKHIIAQRLIAQTGGYLVGTSANLTSKKSPINANGVHLQLGESVDLILDGGETTLKKESSVVRICRTGLEILREGAVSSAQLTQVFRQL